MLLTVKTNGATHIAFNVPTKSAATMLPSIVSLFENNATFVKQGWNELEKVEADISVELKHKFKDERNDLELLIASEEAIEVSEDFMAVSPEVMVSIKKTLDNKQKEVERVRRERDDWQRKYEELTERLEALKEERQQLGLE